MLQGNTHEWLIEPIRNESYTLQVGNQRYELANHLGNVLAVVSDKKEQSDGVTWSATVLSATDYYPFGMAMPGRSTDAKHRYGFNGKETDPETGLNDFGARLYDNRLGRWLAMDPLAAKFPAWSPYVSMNNSPIRFMDPNGMAATDPDPITVCGNNGTFTVSFSVVNNGLPDEPNHRGVQIQITYTPKDKSNRSSLGFVQIIRYRELDGTLTKLNDDDPQRYRRTSGGYAIDRGVDRCSGFFGMTDEGTPNGRGYSFNTDGDPVFWDSPGISIGVVPFKDGRTDFEVYVVNTKTGVVGDGLSWSYQITKATPLTAEITPLPVKDLGTVSSQFKEAVPLWNAQAAKPKGSGAIKNCEDQQPLNLLLDK